MAAETLKLSVDGMTCANCARTVANALQEVPGVTKAEVDLQQASATIEYDTDLVKPDVLTGAVNDLGFAARSL